MLVGWTQSKVSKIENGRTRPSPDDVTGWLKVCVVTGDRRTELLELAELVATDSSAWNDIDRDGIAQQQRDRHVRESDAHTMRIYQPKVIPGVFQTVDYTRHLLLAMGRDPKQVDEAVTARAERQSVLYDSTKSIEAVIVESVLRWRPGHALVTLGQLDRLRTITALPNVNLGIVSDKVQEEALTATSFVLKRGEDYADVQVETLTHEHTFTSAGDLKQYDKMFEYQQGLAVHGDEALELVERNIDYLRTLI